MSEPILNKLQLCFFLKKKRGANLTFLNNKSKVCISELMSTNMGYKIQYLLTTSIKPQLIQSVTMDNDFNFISLAHVMTIIFIPKDEELKYNNSVAI